MARISTYDQDSSLNKLDKLIGTDSATDGTKNFTISSLIQLINDLSAINMFDGLSYEYQAYDADATDPEGILNITGTSLNNTAFSAITQLIISKKGHESPDVENYINALDGGRIKVSEQANIDNFGIFRVVSIQDYTNDRYMQLTVEHDESNGTLTAGTRYHLSNYQASIDSNLSTRNVTEFGDVNNAGSGYIITNAERNIVTDALTHNDVVDNVTSTATNVPLSANQGKILKGLIESINTLLTSDNVQLDTLQEVVDYIETNRTTLDSLAISNITGLQAALNAKQNTEAGKGLSTNDFTNALLNKLNGIATGAQVNVQTNWNGTGDAAILNKPTNFIFTTSSATALNDINSVGSGYIITDAERNSITSTHSTFIGLSSTERAKLTGVETNADVTDTQNVVAALTAGSNITIDANGTISSTDTNTDTNTTYDLTVAQSGDDAQISLEGSDNVDDNITLVAGNNVDLTVNAGNTTIDVDLSTGAVADGATTLVTGDHVFDHTTNFARKDQNETFAGNVTIQGDLTVSGTQQTVLSNDVNIGDATITLNSDLASNAAPSENAGIDVNRGNAATVSIRWDEQNDAWQFTNDGTTYENINADHPLNDLTDVNITNLQNDQVLKYNSTTSKWENQTDAGGIVLTDLSVGAEGTASGDGSISYDNTTGVFTYTPPDLSSYVDGTGTAGTLPKMSDADTITDSSISESGEVITVDSTGAIKVPSGTTTERNAITSPVNGMFRYNSTDAQFEGYADGAWGAIAGSGGGSSTFNVDKISGDGSSSFTLAQSVSDENNTQVYIDGVYQSKDNYSINGTSINFTTAPPTGTDNIEVVSVTSLAVEETSTLTRDSFTGNGNSSFNLSVTPTSKDLTFVYIQGVYQEKSTYSLSGNTITFTTAPQNGYTFEVMSLSAANITQTSYMASDEFSNPTQDQTSFTLANGTPSNKSFTMVFISGVYQDKSTYSLTNGAIVLSEGVDAEDTVEVISIGNGGVIGKAVSDANDARYSVNVISANTTAVAGAVYVFTASLTLTLPASPEIGESIKISNRSGVETCVLGRNGNKILGAAADLTLDTASASFELIYSGTAQGWVIIGQ